MSSVGGIREARLVELSWTHHVRSWALVRVIARQSELPSGRYVVSPCFRETRDNVVRVGSEVGTEICSSD